MISNWWESPNPPFRFVKWEVTLPKQEDTQKTWAKREDSISLRITGDFCRCFFLVRLFFKGGGHYIWVGSTPNPAIVTPGIWHFEVREFQRLNLYLPQKNPGWGVDPTYQVRRLNDGVSTPLEPEEISREFANGSLNRCWRSWHRWLRKWTSMRNLPEFNWKE